jgi:hypothetical protein
MRTRVGLPVVGVVLVASTVAAAAEAPAAVSPGDASKLALIGEPCPTFLWGALAGAEVYELVVYRLGDEGQEATPVLKEKVPGSALGWTPSLGRCLERGGQYAWSVRAEGSEEVSDWSAPSLFAVSAGPTAEQFQEALEVVRTYLAMQDGAISSIEGVAEVEREGEANSAPTDKGAAPEPQAASPTALKVDQGIEAASFTGDGSSLTSVNADTLDFLPSSAFAASTDFDAHTVAFNIHSQGNTSAHHPPTVNTTCDGVPCDGTDFSNVTAVAGDSATGFFSSGQVEEARIADEIARDGEIAAVVAAIDRKCPGALGSGDRYTDCADGTVRDNNTGLYWLKDASCPALGPDGGKRNWAEAQIAVGGLMHGQCGLSDNSNSYEWRLPTLEEFCSYFSAIPPTSRCDENAAEVSLIDSSIQGPAVNEGGTAFVGVQWGADEYYWTATESDSGNAWAVYLATGDRWGPVPKSETYFIWPVRDP